MNHVGSKYEPMNHKRSRINEVNAEDDTHRACGRD
jgi:hypothetical protein